MPVYLLRKLENFAELSLPDRERVWQLTGMDARQLKAHQDLVRMGEPPRFVHVLLDGWAFRYVDIEDGRRQILGIVLPGDVCDLSSFILKRLDHSIAACTAARFARIPADIFLQNLAASPNLDRAFRWAALVEEAMARAWISNVGQRSAIERLAHLFVELFLRLDAIGLVKGQSCEFPLTQEQLAEAVGMTNVHVNRSLMELRAAGLIVLNSRTLTIPDLAALRSAALFDDIYLHLDER
jgi:CRP-like cAMP-binding protein